MKNEDIELLYDRKSACRVTDYRVQSLNNPTMIKKDYVIDYKSALANVIIETESGAGSLTYRYVYGLQKLSVSVSPITTGVGNLIQNGRVKLWYHQDRLGSTDFLTDNISGKVTSYVTYDDWGAPTMKAILKLGLRELDLVTNYTVHPYNPALGVLTGPSGPAAVRSSALRACFNGASLTTPCRGCMIPRLHAGYRWILRRME